LLFKETLYLKIWAYYQKYGRF